MDEINVLKITLHNQLIGYQNGRNILYFSDEFKHNLSRPTFSLTTHW